MMRKRRTLLPAAGGTAALGACSFSLEHGLFNPCRAQLPQELASDEAVLAAWDGIDAARVWDCHAHLIGSGDSGGGIWLNPDLLSIANPVQYAQRLLYLNAGCAQATSAFPGVCSKHGGSSTDRNQPPAPGYREQDEDRQWYATVLSPRTP